MNKLVSGLTTLALAPLYVALIYGILDRILAPTWMWVTFTVYCVLFVIAVLAKAVEES